MSRRISMAVIRRMPKYYRYLNDLKNEGVSKISSRKLAESMGLTASQVRQDFNCFGGFGQQGYGYNVDTLHSEIASIIGVNRKHKAIIIGVGNIGRALINNFDFYQCGFTMIAAFDTDKAIVGKVLNKIPVLDVSELDAFYAENPFEVAVLTLPKAYAREIAEHMVRLGVKGIWNFTNLDLRIGDENVTVEDVHFSDSLMTLCFRITD
ncbi:MAG: redox-sensing transcriptional repressor Rex [Clostridiales bacterium]|jgi:redox-sensing transcriptional repressor|nr:redox-sensing transcriptional repressor Rex [Clostridiales bacterium]